MTFLEDPGTGCGPSNVEGWEFQTTMAITVSALGAYDFELDGMEFPTPVGLFDSSCQLVASATVPAGTSAALIEGFRYVGIAPVTLTAGATYRIAAVMHCDDFAPDFVDTEAFSIDSALTAVQTRRAGGESDLVCPTMTTPGFYGFGANFIIGEACGNGVVQGDEQCDDGNVAGRDCCSPTCLFEDAGKLCDADGHDCTDDVCDGSGICSHDPSPASTLCRPAKGECDVADHCDGQSIGCPPDEFEPNDTPCTDDESFCTGSETCQSGACTSSGNPCGAGTCDEAGGLCLTPTPSATSVPSSTTTATRTQTATRTATATASVTLTATASATSVGSATATRTAASTSTRTATATTTGVVTPSTPTATSVSGATATHTTTPSTAVATSTPTDTPGSITCVGDCDGNGSVSVGELITGVNIALGSQGIERCRAFDSSGNQRVEISELVAAVNRALGGCA